MEKRHMGRSISIWLVFVALVAVGCTDQPPAEPSIPRYVPDPPTVDDYQGNQTEPGVDPSLTDVLYVPGGISGCRSGSHEDCETEFMGQRYRGSQTFDLYEPSTGPAVNRPVIVWLHGGFAVAGDKTDVGNSDYPANLLARQVGRGYVVVSLNYRLNIMHSGPNGTVLPLDPVAAEDLDVAVRYLKAHAAELGIDARRVIVWGHSWGAWAALLQATAPGLRTPSWLPTELAPVSPVVAASVAEAGPSDLPTSIPIALAEVERTEGIGPIDFGTLDPADLAANSPQAYVDPSDSPIYAMHGPNDPLVPINDAESMADRYAAIGRPDLYRLDVVDRAAGAVLPWGWTGHLPHPGANRTELERFLDRARS